MGRLIRWRRRVFQRLVRLQGTSHSVAFGMALGVFMGFLMPPGLQLVVGIPLALLLRANVITTTIGTFVTNPCACTRYSFEPGQGSWR